MRVARSLVILILVLGIGPRAYGHAALAGSDPEPGAKLEEPPQSVRVDYTEPPTAEAVFNVADGCGNEVVDEIEIQNLTIDAALVGGQPGTWHVQWRVISGVDGHSTRDGFSFKVAGKADCSAQATPPPRAGGGGSGSGGGFLIPLGIGTVVLIALALLVRSKAS